MSHLHLDSILHIFGQAIGLPNGYGMRNCVGCCGTCLLILCVPFLSPMSVTRLTVSPQAWGRAREQSIKLSADKLHTTLFLKIQML